MRTLLQTAFGIIKQAKTKLETQKTYRNSEIVKKAVLVDFDEAIAFMNALHTIDGEMSSVKHSQHQP
jgi:hypothetical protein